MPTTQVLNNFLMDSKREFKPTLLHFAHLIVSIIRIFQMLLKFCMKYICV